MQVKISVPPEVEIVHSILKANGYQAYPVGGCVRDSLLSIFRKEFKNRKPKDWDMTTSAQPQEVIDSFKDKYTVVETGLQHGTVTVVINNENIEVTTFRKDGPYDGHHPLWVEWTQDLKEDLARRDFTINAMAYDINTTEIVDPFDGLKDIKNGILTAVGNATERFKEDPLRMMRLFRFHSQLNFKIEKNTFTAAKKLASTISSVSIERQRDEIVKTLLGDYVFSAFSWMYSADLLQEVLPEYMPAWNFDQLTRTQLHNLHTHMLLAVEAAPKRVPLRLALFLHDIAKPAVIEVDQITGFVKFTNHEVIGSQIAESIMRRLKFDNLTINRVTHLIKIHMYSYTSQADDETVRKFLRNNGSDIIEDFIEMKRADFIASGTRDNLMGLIIRMREHFKRVLDENQPYHISHLKLDGNDIIAMFPKMKPGKWVGEILSYLMDAVIKVPDINDKEILTLLVMKRLG